MIKTEDGRVEIKGDYVDLISDFGCIARSIGHILIAIEDKEDRHV